MDPANPSSCRPPPASGGIQGRKMFAFHWRLCVCVCVGVLRSTCAAERDGLTCCSCSPAAWWFALVRVVVDFSWCVLFVFRPVCLCVGESLAVALPTLAIGMVIAPAGVVDTELTKGVTGDQYRWVNVYIYVLRENNRKTLVVMG